MDHNNLFFRNYSDDEILGDEDTNSEMISDAYSSNDSYTTTSTSDEDENTSEENNSNQDDQDDSLNINELD